jgi:hypothetical protein
MRTISGHIFTVKMWARRSLSFVGFHLPEARLAEATVAAEDAAVLAEDRPRGEGRKLIASVGFVKRPMRHTELAESLHALAQMTFVGNAADD